MSQKKKPAAIVVIGILLTTLAAIFFAACSTSPNSPNKVTPQNANVTKAPGIPPSAPPGANPPNQSGSPTATVTIEEFADFQCPTCASVHPVMSEIKSAYGSRIRFIFRNFPLSIPQHDKAYEAAVAAEAAGMQGKFWEMQNLLFQNQKNWTADPNYKQTWKGYASTIGLDVEKWENDRIGLVAKNRVDADLARGKGAGVSSTPTIFINNTEVPFDQIRSASSLRQIIDAELAKATQGQPTANTSSAPAANSAPAPNAAPASNSASGNKANK